MVKHETVFVAYNRRSGIPWAASLDSDKITDYAIDHNLAVLEVEFIK